MTDDRYSLFNDGLFNDCDMSSTCLSLSILMLYLFVTVHPYCVGTPKPFVNYSMWLKDKTLMYKRVGLFEKIDYGIRGAWLVALGVNALTASVSHITLLQSLFLNAPCGFSYLRGWFGISRMNRLVDCSKSFSPFSQTPAELKSPGRCYTFIFRHICRNLDGSSSPLFARETYLTCSALQNISLCYMCKWTFLMVLLRVAIHKESRNANCSKFV